MPRSERRLAAIMFTDIVGYTSLTQQDESRSMALLEKHNRLLRSFFPRYHGREVKTIGDSFLVEFESALEAVRCATEIQSHIRDAKSSDHTAWRIEIRIGIHLGDVIFREGDVFGDAVNIASRIESLAGPGEIFVSGQVYDQVRNKERHTFTRIESPELKNVSIPIAVYRLELGQLRPEETPTGSALGLRLAVLPFVNMSPDPRDEYFADGMTEEMISTLSRIEEFEVISRTSVMQYKNAPKPIRQVSRELNVGTILEGSVRKTDNKIRVTVQIVDAKLDRHLWAESYDRELQDIFEIQSDVALLTAQVLEVKVLPRVSAQIRKRPTAVGGAYASYLKGRFHWNKRVLEDIRLAVECFTQAIEQDPIFALGYVGLGDCYRTLTTNWGIEVELNQRRARAMVSKALELDPGLAEAHASRGLEFFSDYNLPGAEEEFKKAAELKPSYSSVHQWYAQLLIAQMRWEEAQVHAEKASELDPFSHIVCLVNTFLFEAKRDYGTGLEMAKKAVMLNPKDPGSHFELAWLYGKMKRAKEARDEANRGAELASSSYPRAALGAEAMVSYLRGDRDAVKRLLPLLEANMGSTFTDMHFIADLHFYLGENDKGFECLERSFEKKNFDLFYIKSNEFLDDVRDDPRYHSLLRKLGLE